MSGSDKKLRCEIFQVKRDGRIEYRAFCQLTNGTTDWAMARSSADGIESGFRKDKYIQKKLAGYMAEGERLNPADSRSPLLQSTLDVLAEEANRYNFSGRPIVPGKKAFLSYKGDEAARAMRKELRGLHIWLQPMAGKG